MARNASFPKVRFEEFCSILQSAVVHHFHLRHGRDDGVIMAEIR